MTGFLSFARGSLMLDFVVLAMGGVLPILAFSIYTVKVRRNFVLHKKIQLTLGTILAIVVVAFELDIRINGWQHLARPSPYFETLVFPALNIHILCAVSSLATWTVTISSALKHFAKNPRPSGFSPTHRKWAWSATVCMTLTAVTGWIFYWLAFIAV